MLVFMPEQPTLGVARISQGCCLTDQFIDGCRGLGHFSSHSLGNLQEFVGQDFYSRLNALSTTFWHSGQQYQSTLLT